MSTILHLLRDIFHALSVVRELIGYLATFLRAPLTPRAQVAARLVAAESQLATCMLRIRQHKDPRPRLRQSFRLLWVVLSKFWDGWATHAHLMQPATVKRWHTTAFRVYWRRKSRSKPGRPPVPRDMQALIRRLSSENPLWGAGRIRDTLRLLGFDPPCDETIRKYMTTPKNPRDRSTTWLPFLRNHLDVSWAMDFFVVVTARFALLHVFVVFDHGRRKLIHFAATYSPSMEWVIQQLREATPFGRQPRFMFRDNDGIYGHGVRAFLDSCGIEEVRTAYRSPWQNPFVERFVGTLRRELLDHVVIFGQRHLTKLLREFIEDYYHSERPHRGLEGDTPAGHDEPLQIEGSSKVISFPVCGGLHHRYERMAA